MPLTSGMLSSSRAHGRPVLQDFTVSKHLDRSTTSLMGAVWSGRTIKTVKIQMYTTNGAGAMALTLEYELQDVIVTSVSTKMEAGNTPTEEVTLNYSKMKINHTTGGGPKGTQSAGWDVAANKAI